MRGYELELRYVERACEKLGPKNALGQKNANNDIREV